MTSGQKAFVAGLVIGKNQREAYRAAFPSDRSADKTVSACASSLMKHPLVIQALENASSESIESLLDDKAALQKWVLKQLLNCVLTVKQEGARLKALELVGKTTALFAAQPAAPLKAPTSAELKQQLAERIRTLENAYSDDPAFTVRAT